MNDTHGRSSREEERSAFRGGYAKGRPDGRPLRPRTDLPRRYREGASARRVRSNSSRMRRYSSVHESGRTKAWSSTG